MDHQLREVLLSLCLFSLFITVTIGGALVEIKASAGQPMGIGEPLTIYCSVGGSDDITVYKRLAGSSREFTIAVNMRVVGVFAKSRRYSVIEKTTTSRYLALTITDLKKSDEGTIGCKYKGERAELDVRIKGSVTEVFIDVEMDQYTKTNHKTPGEIIEFPVVPPQSGYKMSCHVQTTSTNISCTMRLAGKDIPGKLRLTGVDPEPMTPLRERIYVFHQELEHFLPNSSYHGQKLECIASTPNYPNVQVRSDVVFDIQHKPVGNCSITQPEDHNGQMIIQCDVSYNPPFMAATWNLQSTQREYDGFPVQSGNVRTYYTTSGVYQATFYLALNCSPTMPIRDSLSLSVLNRRGRSTFTVSIGRPPPPAPTLPPGKEKNNSGTKATALYSNTVTADMSGTLSPGATEYSPTGGGGSSRWRGEKVESTPSLPSPSVTASSGRQENKEVAGVADNGTRSMTLTMSPLLLLAPSFLALYL